MKKAQKGDTVEVRYTGKLEDGSIFDSSGDGDPLSFTLGTGNVIPGFENAVEGMAVGEKKDVTIASDDAYGPHQEELIAEIPRKELPENLDVKVDQALQITQPSGPPMVVVVKAMDDEKVTLDGNHPLAGQALCFEVEVVDITRAEDSEETKEEAAT